MAQTTLLTQTANLIPLSLLSAIVRRFNSDKHNKGLDTKTQLVAMLICQIGNCDSLRDLSLAMRGLSRELAELGIVRAPSKSAIAYENKHRPAEVFKELFFVLRKYLGQLPFACPRERELRRKLISKVGRKVYALDASVITLSARAFPWARYRTSKGGVKLHCCLDWQDRLPACVCVSQACESDNVVARTMSLPADSLILSDRGYADFALLNVWDSSKKNFIVRNRFSLNYRVLRENPLSQEAKKHNVLFDGIVESSNAETFGKYPRGYRLVQVRNEEKDEVVFLTTNNFEWDSALVAQLYRARWSVETFFKELKQGFRVKSFIGTSANAVQTQLWTALLAQLLVHYLRSQSRFAWSFSNLLNTLRMHLFVKKPLFAWLDHLLRESSRPPPRHPSPFYRQQELF